MNDSEDRCCINQQAILYKEAEVVQSNIGFKAIVGDFSRIQKSTLNDFVKVDRNNLIQNSLLGRLTYTGPFSVIQSSNIGSFCSISWGVTIGGGEHDVGRISTHDFLYNDRYGFNNFIETAYDRYSLSCNIGHDVWIAANSTILRGVTVGHGVVVGANAVVTHDIPDYAIVAGNPARIIKFRFEKDIIDKLLKLKWWNYDLETINKNFLLFASKDITQAIKELENI